MSNSTVAPSCALPPPLVAWRSLVSRSIAAWDDLATDQHLIRKDFARSMLEDYYSIDNFLDQRGKALRVMFWFFQRRSAFMSQKRFKKWSRDELDDYILLPALPGFVMRQDCFFISHFWRTQDHPDPNGEYLRLHQGDLESEAWSYIWVDWTCMPQSPRSLPEEAYFDSCLRTMTGIIRNCGFAYFYPPFEPRLWILYEITEYALTCDRRLRITSDIESFLQHMNEMIQTGVQATLAKHNYRCSYDRDKEYLTSWLELIVLLKHLHFDTDIVRMIMDHMTWNDVTDTLYRLGLQLNKYKGTLEVNGNIYTFTPFPCWDDGKYSVKTPA